MFHATVSYLGTVNFKPKCFHISVRCHTEEELEEEIAELVEDLKFQGYKTRVTR